VVITRRSWKPFECKLTRVRISYPPPYEKACGCNDCGLLFCTFLFFYKKTLDK